VRADAAAQAYDSGDSVRSLAQRLGVSPSRVHQLIKEARTRSAHDPGPVVR
jgi:transposase-like protein